MPLVSGTLNKLYYGYCLSSQVLQVGFSGGGVKMNLGFRMFPRHEHLRKKREEGELNWGRIWTVVQTQHSFGWPGWKLRRECCTSDSPSIGYNFCTFIPLPCILSHWMWTVPEKACHQARWFSVAEAGTSVKVTSPDGLCAPHLGEFSFKGNRFICLPSWTSKWQIVVKDWGRQFEWMVMGES